MPLAAARDGLFPEPFQRLTRRATPGFALVSTGLLISALITMNFSKSMVSAYTFMLLITTLATVLPYAFCAVAAFLVAPLAQQNPLQRHWASVLAILSFAVSFGVVAGAGADAVYWSMLLLLIGLPVYVLVKRARPMRTSA